MRAALRTIASTDSVIANEARRRIHDAIGSATVIEATVHDRNITIKGTTPESFDHQKLIEAVAQIPGAKTVTDLTGNRRLDHHTSDEAIQKMVQDKLRTCPSVSPARIGVAVSYGVVQLYGMVRSEVERDAVRDCALRVSGVRSIADDIHIEGPDYASSDLALAAEVQAVLLGDLKVRHLPIRSEVTAGVATLRGRVTSSEEHDALIEVVAHLSGITAVDDQLSIDM